MAPSPDQERPWDFYAVALFAAAAFIHALQWPLMPRFLDIWYHVAVMKGFAAAGGYLTHANWEFAPVGRPHLYPPLVHGLLLLPYRLGLGEAACARLMELALWPAFLSALWASLRRMAGARTAFFALLVASSSYSFYLAVSTYPAFTLALGFTLLAIAFSSWLWLAAAFYTHTQMAWMGAAAFVMHGLLSGRHGASWREAGFAALAALPLHAHQLIHAGSFRFLDVRENWRLEIDAGVYALAAWGLFTRRSKTRTAALCLLVAMLPMAFTHRARFFGGHGMLPFILLAAGWMDTKRSFLAGWLFLWAIASPVLFLQWNPPRVSVSVPDRTWTHAVLPRTVPARRELENTVYFGGPYRDLARLVKKYSADGGIVWSDLPYAGGIVAMLADRPTSTAMMAEVAPSRPMDPMAEAAVWVWFKDPARDLRPAMEEAASRYGRRFAAETDYACLFIPDPSRRAAP